MQILESKKGESYVPVCVLILVIVMIFSGIFVYASAVSVIDTSRENCKVVLDSFVTQNATRIYDSIKQGNDYTESVNAEEFTDAFCDFCTLDETASELYSYDSEGNLTYSLTKPIMSFRQENQLEIVVRYTISVPIIFAGQKIDTANVPVEIVSVLSEKF